MRDKPALAQEPAQKRDKLPCRRYLPLLLKPKPEDLKP
jgi:hypothetical protein